MEKASEDEGAALDDTPSDDESEEGLEFVEVDPTGRYGRYNEILGKGAYKTVYRAFDELDGIEVAWNQVKFHDVLHNAGDIDRLYSELHLLKTLKHKNIIKFYNSWVDTRSRNVNFITEIFTSGTLRQYRRKHKHVKLKAVKNWSRQILRGLVFLHSRDPPIIHRDLKCDNIFINGNNGEVKIGDLGLATILRRSPAAQSVIGTPEFMAPELYEEHYNELVDIYSFGMCLLEMITAEYPYSECANAAQIYKKVTTGKKPAALAKIKDPEIRVFVEKCIAAAPQRLQARELLMDPFLRSDEDVDMPEALLSGHGGVWGLDTIPENAHLKSADCLLPAQRPDEVSKRTHSSNEGSLSSDYCLSEMPLVLDPLNLKEGVKSSKDFRIKGRKQDDKKVLVRIRIASPGGEVRVIQFDFDVDADTAMSVASEMVTELDLSDQDVTTIADMIDAEIMALIPDWKPGLAFDEAVDNDTGKEQSGLVDTPLIQDGKDDGSCVGTPGAMIGHSDESLLASGLTYGRFEEVGCNVSGLDQQQQEADGMGFFSDFSSEQFECSGSDSSMDAQSSFEIGVDNDLTIQSLEGVETVDKAGSLPSLDGGQPGFEEGNGKGEHLVSSVSDLKLDDSDISRLIMQQQEELQILQSKHQEALCELKMRLSLSQDVMVVKDKVLLRELSLCEVRKEELQMSEIRELHTDSKLEPSEAAPDGASISNGPPLVSDKSQRTSFAISSQDGILTSDVMPISDNTRGSHEMVASERCSRSVVDRSKSSHDEEIGFVGTSNKDFKGALDNVVLAGLAERKSSNVSDKTPQFSKAMTDARSMPSNHEDVKPGVATIAKRESYLELYKALNGKDKLSCSRSSESLGTMDGAPKTLIPKDANQEQLKKIADFADKNIANLSQSKNKYLANSSFKSITSQNGQQGAASKNHGATIQTGQQGGAAKNTPSAMIQNGQQSTAVKTLATAPIQNSQQGAVVKNPSGTVVQNCNVKILPGSVPYNNQQGSSVKNTVQTSQQVTSGKSLSGVMAQNSQQSGHIKNVTGVPVQSIQQGSAGKINLGATLHNGTASKSLAGSNVQISQQESTTTGHARQQPLPTETTRA